MKLSELDHGTRFFLTALPDVKGKVIWHGVGSSTVDFGARPKKTDDDEDEDGPEDRTLFGRLHISLGTEVTLA